MNAALAIIAGGGWAIVVKYREGVETNYFLLYFIDYAETLQRRPRDGSIMVGMFVFLCLASQKPSEREFLFPPEWT